MMEKITSWTEASKYVAGKYVFNAGNYPELMGLSKERSLVFKIKHSLLHMQKDIVPMIVTVVAFKTDDPKGEELFKTSCVKMIVDCLSLNEILRVPPYSSVTKITKHLLGNRFSLVQHHQLSISDIASQIEKYDHGKTLDFDRVIKQNALIISKTVESLRIWRFSQEDIFKLIPEIVEK